MNKKIRIVLAVLFVVIGGYWYIGSDRNAPEEKLIIDAIVIDTSLVGNQVISADHKMVLQKGASLTVEGNLTIDGVLSCEGGPAIVSVTGALEVNNRIECMHSDKSTDSIGIVLAAAGPITFSTDAQVVSSGSVQIVSNMSASKKTQSEINALFTETGIDSGVGARIGPFSEGALQKVLLNGRPIDFSSFASVREAHAQVSRDKDSKALPQKVIAGTWTLGSNNGAHTSVNKVMLNFDFGKDADMIIKDFHLRGPRSRDGNDDIGKSCDARGGRGEDAFRVRVNAANIMIDNFRLELGDGGAGGNAETLVNCDSGRATGGAGGIAGNFKMTALGKIVINNFHIVPGRGGQGGSATAIGKPGMDACHGTKGGDAIAIGGAGGKNKKELSALGAVEGIGTVTIDKVDGGDGGPAFAKPGKGGNGTACKCNGGKGGSATATGGKGGDASLKLTGVAGEAIGGDGGDANADAADGGAGGSCPLKPKGGNGGDGGNAVAKIGKAGKGTTADGAGGIVQDEIGGDGGKGGEGCGPGSGGKGGIGEPNGVDGKLGELKCPDDKKSFSQ